MTFTYRPPSADVLKRHAAGEYDENQRSADIIKPGIPIYKPGEGDHIVRILPPTWPGSKYYGLPIQVHYAVGGADRFVCPGFWKEPCPICEERVRAYKDDDREYAKTLFPTRRVLYWVIDRNAADPTPHVWVAPATKIDQEIAAQAYDPVTQELLLIDHPTEGYDVGFKKEGQGLTTQWSGVRLARRQSPIHPDPNVMARILEYIEERPLPSVLVHPEYEMIKTSFSGGARAAESDSPQTGVDDIEDDIPF